MLKRAIAAWLDPSPPRIAALQYDALLKAARRCAHDLGHCADDAGATRVYMTSRQWNERASEWLKVFYPDDGPKDYVIAIERTYERRIAELKRIMRASGINPDDHEVPF